MTIEKKLLGTNPSGGSAVNVADVFSTYLYTGTGANRTITNGIDLAGEGGMVWFKDRNTTNDHMVFDTERGVNKFIYPSWTGGESTAGAANALTSFNSDGFDLGSFGAAINPNNQPIVSWTFRKARKFFDVVTYTGNGVAGREIAHSLGCAVGMVHVKRTNTANNWVGWHKGITNTQYMSLNSTNQVYSDGGIFWGSTTPTDTVLTLGSDSAVNASGSTYVAYLFADNTAEDADDQMIKCGSYTSASTSFEVDLGWEPQYILYKRVDGAGGDWAIEDNMRGLSMGQDPTLAPNTAAAEGSTNYCVPTATGFIAAHGDVRTIIYMAIRAPMMKEPESATEVFAVDTKGSTGDGKTPAFRSPFAADMFMLLNKTNGFIRTTPRLTLRPLDPTTSAADAATNTNYSMDFSNGAADNTSVSTDQLAYLWKRAKGFFDVVAYTGTGVAGRTVAHSLGVVPDMIWVKRRSAVTNWSAYHADVGNNKEAYLDLSNGFGNTSTWNNTTPTDTLFTGNAGTSINASGSTYIAYLFASLDGVSKVGSYTGNGSSQTINCGFSAGARFILIKRTDTTGDWYYWDTTRGIVAGNDPHLSLNTTAAQVTSDDSVDPVSSGFGVNQVAATNINVSSASYIFYAIA